MDMSKGAAAAPAVTLAIFCFRQAPYIRAAVESALSQSYQPLEIIISDDASPDDTFEIVQEVVGGYAGPHQVRLNRNPANLGIGAHVNRMMELASGDIVVVAAGDDVSRADRVERIVAAFDANQDCQLVHSSARLIDAASRVTGRFEPKAPLQRKPTLQEFASGNLAIIGATGAWRRKVFERFGPLHEGVVCEDLIVPFRAAMMGDVCYICDELVDWRRVGISSDFQSKRGRDVLFGGWVTWQRFWRNAYRDRARDLRHFYGEDTPPDVLAICEREAHRFDSVVRLAEVKRTLARLPLIARLLADRSLPLGWRAKTGLIYAVPGMYAAFYDWKMRRGLIGQSGATPAPNLE